MKKVYFCLLSILAVCATLTSCSNEDEILSRVPAESLIVGKVNVTRLADDFGVKITGEDIQLPDYLQSTDIDADNLKALASLNKAVDLDQVVMISEDGSTFTFIAKITDKDALNLLMKDQEADVAEEEDATIYTVKTFGNVIVKDKLLWLISNGSGKVADIEAIEAKAKENSILKLKGCANLLSKDNLFTLAVNTKSADETAAEYTVPELLDCWAGVEINAVDNKLVCESSQFKADGSELKLEEIGEINSSILSYVPSTFRAAIAFGKLPESQIDMLYKLINSRAAYQARAIMGVIEPYIRAIDGTVMIAAGPKSDEFYQYPSIETLDAILMIHMPQDKINEAVNMINSQLTMLSVTPVEVSEGLYGIDFGGLNIYYGTVDGYLAFSTINLVNNNSNDLTKYFVNHKFAGVVNVPSLSTFDTSLPAWAPLIYFQSADMGKGKAVIELQGTTEPFFETLGRFFATMK
ncbi:MAG: hypothetical protein NC098_00990 [Lachnoclostridium sp.]|nr:hypothetical protein [Lachnoclostridium sp.]